MNDRREFLETLALGGVALAVGACATASSPKEAPLPAAPPAAGDAYPIVFTDAIWAKYDFGRRIKAKDPRTLAQETHATYEATRTELIAGLLPDVTVVPAMVVALGLAQERGCAYVYAGA